LSAKKEEQERREAAAAAKKEEQERRRESLETQRQAVVDDRRRRLQTRQDETERRKESALEQRRLSSVISSPTRRVSSLDDSFNAGSSGTLLVSSSGAVSATSGASVRPFHPAKRCTLCNVRISSEFSLLVHLRSASHQAEAPSGPPAGLNPLPAYIVDVTESESQAVMTALLDSRRKRVRKVLPRLAAAAVSVLPSAMAGAIAGPNPLRGRLERALSALPALRANKELPTPEATVKAVDAVHHAHLLEGGDSRVISTVEVVRFAGSVSLALGSLVVMGDTQKARSGLAVVGTSEYAAELRAAQTTAQLLHLYLNTHAGELVTAIMHTPSAVLTLLQVLTAWLAYAADGDSPAVVVLAAATVVGVTARVLKGIVATPGLLTAQWADDMSVHLLCHALLDRVAGVVSVATASPATQERLLPLVGPACDLVTTVVEDLIVGSTGAARDLLASDVGRTDAVGLGFALYALLNNHLNETGQAGGAWDDATTMAPAVVDAACRIMGALAAIGRADRSSLQAVVAQDACARPLIRAMRCILEFRDKVPAGLIVAVASVAGHMAAQCPALQEVFSSGPRTPLISLLAALPLPFFADPQLESRCVPALAACGYGHARCTALLHEHAAVAPILAFISAAIKGGPDSRAREALTAFFPPKLWPALLENFSAQLTK
jgi:hypothetical protein